MKLLLKRTEYRKDGIFGILQDEDGNKLYNTCEHAYLQEDGSYAPKLNLGLHTCNRGKHRLHGMTADFETFEITGVPDHTGILFHWGNYNEDSEGCVLLGAHALLPPGVNRAMITDSRDTFTRFMRLVQDLKTFDLEVI